MKRHRFAVGDIVRIVKNDMMGLPGPVGTLMEIGYLNADGWYQSPDGTRIAPEEITEHDPTRPDLPEHVTITRRRWEDIQDELSRGEENRSRLHRAQSEVERYRSVLPEMFAIVADPGLWSAFDGRRERLLELLHKSWPDVEKMALAAGYVPGSGGGLKWRDR
jgi:hypothetical protein